MLYDILMISTFFAGVMVLVWLLGVCAWMAWQIHLGNRADEDHE